MSETTPNHTSNVSLKTYHALCEKKFDDNDDAHDNIRKEIHGVRKLLWGLLVSIVLVLFTVTATAILSYAKRDDRIEELRAVVEEVVKDK